MAEKPVVKTEEKPADTTSMMDEIKKSILNLNNALEWAAQNDVNVGVVLKESTRPEFTVPLVQINLNSAHKQLYKPLIMTPR
jgi:hypothetical protein